MQYTAQLIYVWVPTYVNLTSGAMTDAKGLHRLSCKGGTGRSARHHSLNDLVWHALVKVSIPFVKEPSSLSRLKIRWKTSGRPDANPMEEWQMRDDDDVTLYL